MEHKYTKMNEFDDIMTKENNQFTKKEIFDIIYKILVALFLVIIFINLQIRLDKFLDNANNLTEKILPKEIKYIHKIIEQHNHSITMIENEMIYNLEYYNANNITNQIINMILETNMSEFGVEIHSIACSLKKLTNNPDPC